MKPSIPSYLIYLTGQQRKVSLACGYYYSDDHDVWFLMNSDSDSGIAIRFGGEHFGYWQGDENQSCLEMVRESYPDMTHISL
jgi:hypothetical protein